MVGKGDVKGSRIFHQCYVKCCKLQNLTPLTNVIPSVNGKVIDFCVDRIKYVDWPPILNALSCDLSLHTVSIRCRQQVKTVLEHIDCERLAKTVNKRAVILTKFMLSNLIEAVTQLLSNTTLLSSLLLEGLPLRVPYLNPICEALLTNNSLQHLYLSRCLIGDAGCLAICKAVRCLPNILTMDLGSCDLTAVGVGYIADLIKYQKIHRYSENWVHTLRYRSPDLDAMAGLRRITLCGNMLGDARRLFDALADDLWIKEFDTDTIGQRQIWELGMVEQSQTQEKCGSGFKRLISDFYPSSVHQNSALDIQNCGLTEECASAALQMMRSNTSLVVLDLRHNPLISTESLSKIRSALRENERGIGGQFSWLGNVTGCSNDGRIIKSIPTKNIIVKDRVASNVRNAPNKYAKISTVKKEKDYTEVLEEQLQEEISHRQQLEELNLQLVEQMKALKQQHLQIWANGAQSSGSEQSFQASSRSGDLSSSSGSTSSVPIDQNTLSYIQQAFKDIYAFIKNNQCHGQCLLEKTKEQDIDQKIVQNEAEEVTEVDTSELRINIKPKKAQSTHIKLTENVKVNKTTKSAHLLGDMQHGGKDEMKLEMFERQMGDSKNAHGDEANVLEDMIAAQTKKSNDRSPCDSPVSDSSDTLVYSPTSALNPRDAMYSSSDEDD